MRKALLAMALATCVTGPVAFAQAPAPASADAAATQSAQTRKPLSAIGRALAGLLPPAGQARAPATPDPSHPAAADATAQADSANARAGGTDAPAVLQAAHRDARAAPVELAAAAQP
jgi:hypothetical protein